MSERKERFTPGPWTCEDTIRGEVEGPNGEHICQNQLGGNREDEEEANASLIAAAPEMYKHLDALYGTLMSWADLEEKSSLRELYAQMCVDILHVLQKARGEL